VAAPTELTLGCGKLRIEFQRAKDRWGHVIGLADVQGFHLLARSVEGKPDDLWPASPALQELHLEDRADGQVAFLTGMAGSSHWSASIACEPAYNRATFDFACRCKQPPTWLGSLYQISEGVAVWHQESRMELKLPQSDSRLIVSTTSSLGFVPQFPADRGNSRSIAFAESGHGLQQTLFIAPATLDAGTIRWIYSLALEDASTNRPKTSSCSSPS
jgi:hypothetical protein